MAYSSKDIRLKLPLVQSLRQRKPQKQRCHCWLNETVSWDVNPHFGLSPHDLRWLDIGNDQALAVHGGAMYMVVLSPALRHCPNAVLSWRH
jgi:hypothetical protein